MCNIIKPLFVILFMSVNLHAQSIIDEFSDNTEEESINYDLTEEIVLKQSLSKRIFILTNQENSFAEGDYVSLLLSKKLVVRGLIAKNIDQGAAFKVTKVYSTELFNAIVPRSKVQVIRGDDSFYRIQKPKGPSEPEFQIETEDDLFDETTLLDDEEFESPKKGGKLKNDNIISFGFGYVSSYNPQNIQNSAESFTLTGGDEASTIQLNASYSYQVIKDFWIEGMVGVHDLADYPNTGLDTKLWQFTGRLKYAISGPLYTFFLPYIGFQITRADSPSAGSTSTRFNDAVLAQEIISVETIEEQKLVIGVTILRRLVPGWFIKADLGTDILGFGLALEF